MSNLETREIVRLSTDSNGDPELYTIKEEK